MRTTTEEYGHDYPVWYAKANYIIRVMLPNENNREEREQLWARQHDDGSFELCCVPFFAYALALGDRVLTDHDAYIVDVARRSGRSVVRINFEEDRLDLDLIGQLFNWGCFVEKSSERYFAVDVPNEVLNPHVIELVEAAEAQGILIYEIGHAPHVPA